jgi:HK97 family phage portal protein
MSVLDWFRRAVDASSFGFAPVDGFDGTASGERVSVSSSMRVIAVKACVSLIGDAIAGMPVDLYQKRNGISEEIEARPSWLERPNADQTWRQYSDFVMQLLLLRGNAYSFITARDDLGFPLELTPINPEATSIYVRRKAGRKQIVANGMAFDPYTTRNPEGEILHIMGISLDGMVGLAPIEDAAQSIGLALAQEKHGAKLFGQGVQTTGVVQIPVGARPSQPEITALGNEFRRKYQGTDNAWRPIILANGATYNPISMPNDQAQFIESRKFSVTEIARLFGVPPFMVGDVEKTSSWGTGIESQGIGFVTYTLSRWLTRLEDAYNQITPRGQYVKFNVNSLLRSDIKTRYESYALGRQWGWLSGNEIRGLEDLPPRDELESTLIPMNMVQAGQNDSEEMARQIAEIVQKVYLGVGKVITADEAREILNQAGASLSAGFTG